MFSSKHNLLQRWSTEDRLRLLSPTVYRWVTTNCCLISALTLVPPRLPSGRTRIQDKSTTPATSITYDTSPLIFSALQLLTPGLRVQFTKKHTILHQCHTFPILLPLGQSNSTYIRSVFYLTTIACHFLSVRLSY
jgi:hypothetical protein